jgi:phage baseplate assembly protein gpV
MKILRKSIYALALSTFFFASCEKEEVSNNDTVSTEASQVVEISPRELSVDIEQLEAFRNLQIDGEIGGRMVTKSGFSFANPGTGINYRVQGVGYRYTSSGEIYYTTAEVGIRVSGNGFTAGGGSLVVGDKTINLDYVFCANVDMSAFPSVFEFPGDGFSTLIGLSGSFEDYDPESEEMPIQQIVYFIVYDNNAQGSYDVIDLDLDSEEEETPSNIAFAMVVDFEDGGMYFSSDGTLNVNGGSIEFNGQMFDFTQFFIGGEADFDEDSNYSIEEVSAVGTLNCGG